VLAIDKDYPCKQDTDPSDWLGKLAANVSGGEEATPIAAGSVMAPNTDNGLFGNPEDYNKFTLTMRGQTLFLFARTLYPSALEGGIEPPPSCHLEGRVHGRFNTTAPLGVRLPYHSLR
jgi:hypothetical protein